MHLKKRMTFHGVEYIVVPRKLWEVGVGCTDSLSRDGWTFAKDAFKEMLEYEGKDEELTDE